MAGIHDRHDVPRPFARAYYRCITCISLERHINVIMSRLPERLLVCWCSEGNREPIRKLPPLTNISYSIPLQRGAMISRLIQPCRKIGRDSPRMYFSHYSLNKRPATLCNNKIQQQPQEHLDYLNLYKVHGGTSLGSEARRNSKWTSCYDVVREVSSLYSFVHVKKLVDFCVRF